MKNYRTYLRAIEPGDWSLLNKWHVDEEVYQTTMANKFFISPERDKTWANNLMINNSDSIFWAICLCDTNEMIGCTSLVNIDQLNKKAYIGGITIDQQFQDLKLGFDSFDQVLDYAFNELVLNKLSSGYLVSQMKTAHGLRKYGFKEEFRLREEIYKLGKYHDVIVVSFLSSDFKDKMSFTKE